MKVSVVLLVLTIMVSSHLFSQKAPIKFGDVTVEELQMTTYQPDTSAPAVILCKYGYFRANMQNFTMLMRIKILKKEGYNWATWKFDLDFKSSVKGIVSNLENGKIVQQKIPAESIFKTRVYKDYNYISVAAPNVKEGSVIDLELVIEGIPREWRFQEEIPTVYNELVLEESSSMILQKNFYGYEPISTYTPTRWIARNMPAFKKEPVMNSPNNYMTRLELDILQINGVDISTDWYRICELLYEYTPVGLQGVNTSFLNDVANDLQKKYRDKEQLMRAALDTVRQKIYWDEYATMFISSPNLGEIFKKGVGSSAQINSILIRLLDKVGIEVYPVVLRTREKGALAKERPSISQLNYLVAYAKIGEKGYVLDASEKYMPYYLLPLRCLNGEGRLVSKQRDIWVPLTCSRKNREVDIYDLRLEKDLSLKGTANLSRYDYAGYEYRKHYSSYNGQDDYFESFLKDYPGMRISDAEIDNLDSLYKPVIQKSKVAISGRITVSENSLYLVPAYFNGKRDNPFVLPQRKYPVDYGILPDETLIINLAIPEGLNVVSLPQSVNMKLKDNAAVYIYQAVQSGSTVKITAKFTVNKMVFHTDEYNDLREFYNQMIKKLSEAVILKQI